ncbi:hypothetical protein [Pseudomonas aeruginosa]|uniref:hypothetical protein n=1 Tax=Pseudomonas aeruginosa TaxID=287 RepID=UPI00094718E9|nr:hypothetical protein [Pseudomonas aeruginosa]
MSQFELNPDVESKINLLLGRELSQSEKGGSENFYSFTENDLTEFRLLEESSGILAVSYIRYKLSAKIDLNAVVAFYAAVVQQKIPIEEWMAMR